MNISRKDFLKKGLFSVGEFLCTAVGITIAPETSVPEFGEDPEPVRAACPGSHAVARNERCLAGKCGCFICTEHCGARAITLIPGVGIKIDPTACTGCGTCAYLCPVVPKAVSIVPATG